MATSPYYPNSEIYILKNIAVNDEDKVNFYGLSAQFQISYFLGAEYEAPTGQDFATTDYLAKYPNCVYCGFKYSVVKDKYIDIPININDVRSGNYLVYRNNIPPFATATPLEENSVDTTRYIGKYNTIAVDTDSINNYANTDFIYCFIQDIEFLNANTTRIYIKKDNFTTYCRNIKYKQCFIEREHTVNQPFYYDYIKEDFSFDTDVKSYRIAEYNSLGQMYCLILSESDLSYRLIPKEESATGSEPFEISNIEGKTCTFNGVDTGLYAYCFLATSTTKIKQLIKNASLIGQAGEIKKIIYLPLNGTVPNATVTDVPSTGEVVYNKAYYQDYNAYYITQQTTSTTRYNIENRITYPLCTSISSDKVDIDVSFSLPPADSTIRNNKTYSYMKLSIVGDKEVEIPIHLLTGQNIPLTTVCSNILPNSTVVCYLTMGDGSSLYANKQCFCSALNLFNCGGTYDNMLNSLSAESQKLLNARTNGVIDVLSNLGQAGVTAAVMPFPFAALGVAGGLTSAVSSAVATDLKIDSAMQGIGRDQKTSVVDMTALDKFSMGVNGFYLKQTYPTHTYMKVIDDYFSVYGYKVNRYGAPKFINSQSGLRKIWNYIKTSDCRFMLNRPLIEVEEIRNLFNKGVRLWTPQEYTDFANNKVGFGGYYNPNSLNEEV